TPGRSIAPAPANFNDTHIDIPGKNSAGGKPKMIPYRQSPDTPVRNPAYRRQPAGMSATQIYQY
ncbi:MAG: hypothetical protein PHE95_03770, partial [Candidatus Methanomethylophilus sp.]|nr:hypothetical protein [Methanomethylophilus sp.]